MDLVGMGTNAIDQVIRLYRIPTADAKVVCPPERYELFPGGVMGNTLTGAARLGLDTGYIGKIGNDPFGAELVRLAEGDGVDLSACPVVKGERTAWTWIVVDDEGERTITLFPNVLSTVDEMFVREHESYIAGAKILHLEGSEMPLSPFIEAARIARKHGVKVSFDLDIPASDVVEKLRLGTREELYELIRLSDYFIPCIAGGAELVAAVGDGVPTPDEIALQLRRRFGNEVVAVSHGAEGCFVSTEAKTFHSPAYEIRAVDGTGSGDAFHAGMIYGLLKGLPIEETARVANACGAMNTAVLGARSGMRSIEEVRKFMVETPLKR